MLPLTQIKRAAPEAVLGSLRADSTGASKEAGLKLVAQAKEFGLGVRDFLTLAIDPALSEKAEDYSDGKALLSGYEAALKFLNLPVRDDFKNGIVLEAASETFQTFPGTRAMFPEVVDDVIRWKYRQTFFENIEPLVGNTRTVPQPEMISTVVDDKQSDYQDVTSVPEMARIPVKSIRTTQNTVAFHKFGSAYRFSYEFARRARIDLLAPYQTRAQREFLVKKVAVATHLLINGDSVHPAAGVVLQSAKDADATTGEISRKGLMAWLVDRAKAGAPVDTVVGNWDAYLAWLALFTLPVAGQLVGAAGATDADVLARQGFQIGGVPILQGAVNFALSSTMPAGQLMGYSRGDTLEELVEAGSLISESERSILNQTITYVKTENAGYRLVFGDTRSIYNFNG